MIVFILMFLFNFNVFSQSIYSLEDCLKLAKENNNLLKSIEDKKIVALLSLKSTRTLFFFKIQGEFSFSRLNEIPQMNVDFLGVSQSFKIGSQNNYQAKFSLIQSLFTGGKLKNIYKMSKSGYKILNYVYEIYRNNLSLMVKQFYYGVILSKNVLEIRKEAEDFLKENLEVSRNLFKEGRVSSYDVSRNEVTYILSESARIEAENSLKVAMENLKNIIGADIDSIKEGFEEPKNLGFELNFLVEVALKNNPEIKKKQEEVKIQDFNLKSVKSDFFPKLYIGAGYTYENPHYSVEEWGYNWNVFLNLNWDIFSGGKKFYDLKKEKKSREALLNELLDLKEKIKLKVKSEYFSLNSAYKRYLSQSKNVEIAKQNLEIARKRYNQGLLSHLELKDAQVSLTEAELQRLKALFDYHISLSKLLNYLGKQSLSEVKK